MFPGIMAMVSQFVFWRTIKSAKHTKDGEINKWIIIYSYILFTIILSFFSDRFFAYIFNFAFIKRIIFLYFGIWFLNGKIKIKKKVICTGLGLEKSKGI